ncbi:hypothetical protein FB446DRAFT_729769 [Lentinula raphanica]|nr:hypothetical protein FB446DRAFT_729769 [Lentinula raphanica]
MSWHSFFLCLDRFCVYSSLILIQVVSYTTLLLTSLSSILTSHSPLIMIRLYCFKFSMPQLVQIALEYHKKSRNNYTSRWKLKYAI